MPRDIEANIPNNRSTQSSCTLSPSSKIWEDNGARGLTSGTRLLPIVVYLLDRPSLLTLTLVYDAEGQKDMLLRIRSAANQTMRSHGLLPWWRCMFHAPVIGHAVVEQVLPCCHPSSSTSCLRVGIKSFRANVLLTDLYRRLPRSKAAETSSFVDMTPDALHQAAIIDTLSTNRVLAVHYELDRSRIAWLLIGLLSFAPILGFLTYWFAREADAAIGASTAVFAFAAVLQGVVAWAQG